MADPISLTREQIYELVWAEPVSRLARRYGLTDYKWRQLCVRMSIPVPRPQHWRKLQMGEATERPPLSKSFTGDRAITLSVTKDTTSGKSSAESSAQSSADQPPRKIRSAPEDPIVTSARYRLQQADKRWLDNGLVWTKGKYFRIGVAPGNVERACRFVSAFLEAVRRRGYQITVEEKDTLLHLGYQPLPIHVRERTRRVTQIERKSSWMTSQLIPGGDLYLHMTYQFKERDWKIGDGAMPDEADAMLDRLESASQRVDEYYRDLERVWAENDARRKLEQNRQERRDAEVKGFKKLIQSATRWQQAEWIRTYLIAMERREVAASPGGLSSEGAAWFAWARAKADWYDPLTETPDEWLAHIDRNNL